MTATEEHASLMPVANPTHSYWRSELHHLDSHHSTPELPKTSDVVIIGAGMAGVSVAYHLSKAASPPSTLLLEARQTCSGATGRNGGHIKAMTISLLDFIASDPNLNNGIAAANELNRFVQAQIDALKHVVEEVEGFAEYCEFELRRSFDIFYSTKDAEEMREKFQECLARGDEWTRDRMWIGPPEFAERVTSIRGCKGAFSVPACSLWPYKFVMGLLERTLQETTSTLNLQTETPVTHVEEVLNDDDDSSGESIVYTPRGSVRAKKVIFATNAYTGALLPEYRGVIKPYKGTAAHLAGRKGGEPVYPHLSHTYNLEFEIKPGHVMRDYLNPRPDGGIVVGGGKWIYEHEEVWDDTVDDSTVFESVAGDGYFEGYMQRNFRGWEDSGAVAEKIWTGIMGATPDGYPHIGKVPGKKSQWLLAGFNGGGMPMIFLSAKGVAKMTLEDVPFNESDAGIPSRCETTKERLGLK